jgi:hypothetical protein
MIEMEPPAGLDRKIVQALRREGLLKRRPVAAYLAVAAAVLIAVFFLWQRAQTPAAATYILLLYETPQFQGGNRAEYGQWARQMRPLVVGGEELGDANVLAGTTSQLAGYFLIAAPNDERAREVAQACPHLRHGGTVELRRIVQ